MNVLILINFDCFLLKLLQLQLLERIPVLLLSLIPFAFVSEDTVQNYWYLASDSFNQVLSWRRLVTRVRYCAGREVDFFDPRKHWKL
jgi:hypothetical protein